MALVQNDDLKPELDDFGGRNLEDYADRLWQQRVKTERAETVDSDDDVSSYSPTRDNFYYDSYYTGDTDTFRESLDFPLKRSAEEPLSPPINLSTAGFGTPVKRSRGRPYKDACVKITCLRPEDRLTNTLCIELAKLQEEELGIPRTELVGGLRCSSKLPLKWSCDDMRNHILKLFPRVRKFVYMKCNQGKTLDPLPDDIKPSDIRSLLGRSSLYIVPIPPLLPKGTTPVESPVCTETSPVPVSSPQGVGVSQPESTSKQYWYPTKVAGEKVVNDDVEFRITLDVSSYCPDEITLKTKNSRVVVHARHEERADEFGLIEREFKRQYILPKDVDPNEVTSSLSSSGILTLKAPKINKDNGRERIIPIRFSLEDS